MGGGPNQPPLLIGRGSIYLGADPVLQNQYVIPAQRIRAVRVGRKAVRDPRAGAMVPMPSGLRSLPARVARWSRVSRREARPTAAVVAAWLVATKEDKQTG